MDTPQSIGITQINVPGFTSFKSYGISLLDIKQVLSSEKVLTNYLQAGHGEQKGTKKAALQPPKTLSKTVF